MPRTGRPRAFDRSAALDAAMRLFWEHGYETTSLDQLKRAMGSLSPASFYAAFGSKAALFKEALARYRSTYGQVTAPLYDQSLPPRQAIEQSLRASPWQCAAAGRVAGRAPGQPGRDPRLCSTRDGGRRLGAHDRRGGSRGAVRRPARRLLGASPRWPPGRGHGRRHHGRAPSMGSAPSAALMGRCMDPGMGSGVPDPDGSVSDGNRLVGADHAVERDRHLLPAVTRSPGSPAWPRRSAPRPAGTSSTA